MGIDLAQSHGWIVAELARQRPVAESMDTLINQCAKNYPHPDWALLRALPFSDLSPLENWIQQLLGTEPPSLLIQGLWFGLFNPCYDGHSPVADIYLCGSEQFHPDPQDNSWAVGPTWWPDARYAMSKVLAEIYRIAYTPGTSKPNLGNCLGNDAEYPLVLGYGVFAVRNLLERIDPALLPGKADSLGVAVGFDSGDFILVGNMTRNGLVPFE